MHIRARHVVSIILSVLAVATVASAGKQERDKQKALAGSIAAAKGDLKKRCGCNVAVSVNWGSYKTAADMSSIESSLGDLTDATKDNCDDDSEKKILCTHLKTYVVTFDTNGAVSYNGGTLSCGSADGIHCAADQLNKIIDSW